MTRTASSISRLFIATLLLGCSGKELTRPVIDPVATTLTFTVQPTNGTGGSVITPAIQVTAIDVSGNIATSFVGTVTIALEANASGATLSGTTTVRAIRGVATFDDLIVSNNGTGYTLRADASALARAVSAPFSNIRRADRPSGPWISKASIPTARGGLAVGVVNGVLYAVGGFDFQMINSIATVEVYTSLTNSWSTVASMPTARRGLGIGVVDGVLYAVGGDRVGALVFDPSGDGGPEAVPVATVEAYDPVTNSWTTKASMPTARYDLGIGVVNGVLYAVGGVNSSGVAATVEAYNPVTNSWTTKQSVPHVGGMWVGVVNNVLYALAGDGALKAYDPATDRWTTRTAATRSSTPNCGFLGVGVINGDLYALERCGSLAAYDPVTDGWTIIEPTQSWRSDAGVGVVSGSLYRVGGLDERARPVSTVEAYVP